MESGLKTKFEVKTATEIERKMKPKSKIKSKAKIKNKNRPATNTQLKDKNKGEYTARQDYRGGDFAKIISSLNLLDSLNFLNLYGTFPFQFRKLPFPVRKVQLPSSGLPFPDWKSALSS